MLRLIAAITMSVMIAGCGQTMKPIRTMDSVDLKRFMGDWYVVANIPTFIEKGAHNAIESYHMNDDGTIATTFTFRDGSFTGKQKEYTPTGFVKDTDSNAIWGMQFIWPIKADYRIVYVDSDYSQTIIGRNARDYVWIMARTPRIPDREYQNLINIVKQEGYDISKVQRVPQKWN